MKKLIILSMVLFSCLAFTPSSFAADAWYTCDIVKVGFNAAGGAYCVLTDTAAIPAFTENSFIMANAAVNNPALAVLLTAHSLGHTVRAKCDPAANTITVLQIWAQ